MVVIYVVVSDSLNIRQKQLGLPKGVGLLCR